MLKPVLYINIANILFAGHTFGTQNKYGYSLLVYGLVALIVFIVSFGALTNRGQQVAQKCLPSHLRRRKFHTFCYVFAICLGVFLMVIGVILIAVSLVARDKSCG